MIRILSIATLAVATFFASAAAAETLRFKVGNVVYEVAPETLKIDAVIRGNRLAILTGGAASAVKVSHIEDGVEWRDAQDRHISIGTDGNNLRLRITGQDDAPLDLSLARAVASDTWLIPDGQGVAFDAGDAFWRRSYAEEECLSATSSLSFPAWSRLTGNLAITYMLRDGLQSKLCLHDDGVVQGRLVHDFDSGAASLDLRIQLSEASVLAPALAYRHLLQSHGGLKTFADKPSAKLDRLFGAPHAYLWGDGRTEAFLSDLKALGIDKMLLSYDQNPDQAIIAGPDFQARADAMGYLAGPYEAFDNAQVPGKSDMALADWGGDFYPAACIRDRKGTIVAGFANRGCALSSERLRHRTETPNLISRYEGHVASHATHVFIDVDGFGDFIADYNPASPMTMARDRQNRLDRMNMARTQYGLVVGSETVGAWSHGVVHYSHGTAQAHVMPLWGVKSRDRDAFGGYWPPERPPLFFKSIILNATDARALLGAADRIPLFEALIHDGLVSTDRWEFALMKVQGYERQRFARALLFGNPTLWQLDRAELKRLAPWLKAAHDDFNIAHGSNAPVALTGFTWKTPDRRVQETSFADERTIIANFGNQAWRGLQTECVRVTWPKQRSIDLCPPATVPQPLARKP